MPDAEDEAVAQAPTLSEVNENVKRGETKQVSRPSVVAAGDELDSQNPYHFVAITKEHSGPLPPAEYFREINAVIPGGAERVLAMAEKQAAHRQMMEQRDLEAAIDHEKGELSRSNRGLAAGFVTALSFLGAAVYLIHGGHDTAGTIIGSVDIVGLVSVFVIGRVYSGKSPHPDAPANKSEPKDTSHGNSDTAAHSE